MTAKSGLPLQATWRPDRQRDASLAHTLGLSQDSILHRRCVVPNSARTISIAVRRPLICGNRCRVLQLRISVPFGISRALGVSLSGVGQRSVLPSCVLLGVGARVALRGRASVTTISH